MQNRFSSLTAGAFVAAALGLSVSVASAQPATPAQERATHAFGASKPIPDSYIVVFKDSVDDPGRAAENLMRGRGGEIEFIYSNSIKGFSATMPKAAVDALRRHPLVDYIEQNATVTLNATTQSNATWGIDRIDQIDLPLSSTYSYGLNGSGVRAYIIDTGIRASHNEFAGRMLSGATSINDGRGTNDCNGHGTHVAGTVGGTVYGVAKAVSLVPVRVLDCNGSGSWSGVVAGVDWVAGQKTANPSIPMVANMSLGGDASSSVDTAVRKAHEAGVAMVVAAGNSNANACNYSPAREPTAITVGATTNTDARASYSNLGSCLDIFAPGSSITSAWHRNNSATNTISGTSMAAPHVAGVAALLLQSNPNATPTQIVNSIVSAASIGKVSSVGTGSPNLLVYSAPPNPPTGEPSTEEPPTGEPSNEEPPTEEPPTESGPTLSGFSSKSGNGWVANIVLTGSPGQSTSGTWSGTSGASTCKIESGKTTCSFTSNRIANRVGSVTYTDSNNNLSVTIVKP
jgi:aqualysin 1